MRPEDDRCDQELVSLARETRQAADSIIEGVIHARLIEIANEIRDLACPEEKLC